MVFRMSMGPEPLLQWPNGNGRGPRLVVWSVVAVVAAAGVLWWFVLR